MQRIAGCAGRFAIPPICLLPFGLVMALQGACAAERAQGARPAPFRVGVAAVDITPDYPVRLSGFGFRRTESEGVGQPIWAKALAISHGDEPPAVLVTVDNLGIPASMVEDLARRLKDKAGIERERIAVTATHTHTAPMLTNVAPTLFGQPIPEDHQRHIDRYTRELAGKLEQAALAALADRQPAVLEYAVGTAAFAKNRRTPGGPVDHDLPVLFVSSPEGRLRAVWTSYACHAVTLSYNQISGDWAGYAQDLFERAHPGTVALVSVGCGADQNPASGVTGDKTAVAHEQGAGIAAEVERLLKAPRTRLTAGLTAKLATIELPFDEPPARAEWEERAKRDDAIGYHARVQLARLDRGETLQSKLDYPIATWAFGDELAIVFLPGEVVVDYSLRLKRELDRTRLWVNAYANDVPCYIPSERILNEGGYEGANAMVYYDRPTRLKAGLEDRIIGVVREQLGDEFKASHEGDRTGGTLPLTPQQSLAALKTHDRFTVELVAAEPLVVDPVAIDFGPDGRLWVAEMHDYPEGRAGDYQPGGRIRVLSDSDGDGRYETAHVFLDGIPFPTGVTAWRKGVLVCAAPDILYAEDTDGDGRADVKRTLFTGFATHNYQARVNSLTYGLDGWVYGSGGLFGGTITRGEAAGNLDASGGRVTQPVDLENRDFRMRPDEGLIEAATGRTQQGRVRDDWGQWFGCTNGELLKHYPLAEHFIRRNPHVLPPPTEIGITDEAARRLHSIRSELQLFKLSGPPDRATAACGLGLYRDDLLGEDLAGNAFVCEPVNLLVHRMVLSPNGVSFTARRPADEAASEFLASTDNWFRPVQVRTGPDGALWVVDMYRYVIEHPRWIPPETLATLDLRAGCMLGRIYRVVPKDRPLRSVPRLDQMSPVELVAVLESPNGTLRDLAHQLLLWNPDRSAVEPLRELVRGARRPTARLHAMCVLDGLDALDGETLRMALADKRAGVRQHAVRLSAAHVKHSPPVAAPILHAARDSDPHVRKETAYALGESDDPRAAPVLAGLLVTDFGDPWLRASVLGSVSGKNIVGVARAVLARDEFTQAPDAPLAALAGLAAAVGNREALAALLEPVLAPGVDGGFNAFQWQAAAEVLDALRRTGRPLDAALERRQAELFDELIAAARQTAADAAADLPLRLAALDVLGRRSEADADDRRALAALLVPQSPPAVQAAAVAALARFRDGKSADALLAGWSGYSPQLRGRVLDALLSRQAWAARLLDGIEDGQVTPADLDASRRERLLAHSDERLRMRAAALLAVAGRDADRARVVDDYRHAASAAGDATHGKALFAKHCATCHRLDGAGHAVGPELAALTDRSPEALLVAVLDPNRAIDARYAAYVAVTSEGRAVTGIVTDETATSITLAGPDGERHTLLRVDLDELRNTGRSLMPDGVEKELSPRALADLIAYVRAATAAPP
ncbi:MAG TPA: neutral/alkaline non-lysosomal ceramidase N-terminal domain-containing protein [Planctomycetaceae bacterium]|nr:neutral/alkaline non-lysosomal ceramidase N-terminal domain-containing protein [Planctomycetaceae bacterium]